MCTEKFPRDTNMTDDRHDQIIAASIPGKGRSKTKEGFLAGRRKPAVGFHRSSHHRVADSHLLGCKEVRAPKIFNLLSLLNGRRMRGALFPLPYTSSEFIARGFRQLLRT